MRYLNTGFVIAALLVASPVLPTLRGEVTQAQTVQEQEAEADRLLKQGGQQYQTNQYEAALQSWKQALEIYRAIQSYKGEATALSNLGVAYKSLLQYDKALLLYQQALLIFQQIKDRKGEADALMNLGVAYDSLLQYDRAIMFLQKALPIYQQLKNRNGEANTLTNLGLAYRSLSQYDKAITFYQQALPIYQQLGDQTWEAEVLDDLGTAYRSLSLYDKAITFYQQALSICRVIQNHKGEAKALMGLGIAYDAQAQYEKAITFYQQALPIFQQLKDRNGEASTLGNLGLTYQSLAQYEKTITFYQQALPIFQQLKDRNGEASTLTSLGSAYQSLLQYDKSITFYQQALPIFQQLKNRNGEASTLVNLGAAYAALSEFNKAIMFYQQALSIFRQFKDRNGEAIALNNLGSVYRSLSQYDRAITFYQQALPLFQQINAPESEGLALSNIGETLAKQQQPELAIVFYKQSVNVRETIRIDISKLPRESQESYTQSVAGTYRSLADLLIQQGRLSEAQAALELLKLRELREFTRDVGIDSPGISLATIEETALKQILKQFTTLGNFAQKLAECETKKCPELKQIRDQRNALNLELDRELANIRVALTKHYATQPSSLSPEKLNAEASRIVNAQPGTVLIYPLVLKDKVQFLLALKAGNGAVTFRPFETKVSAEELFKTVQTFRKQLGETTTVGTPKADLATVQATSQQLYEWLIKPLEPELNAPGIKHIVFAPDLITRYIPLAALHDGKQYLIQRFTISTITAASKTDTEARVPRPKGTQSLLLAMGVSTFKTLNPLINVPAELDAITKTNQPKDLQGIYPGSEFLNSTFDYEALQASLEKGTYQILHLATHGAFVAGRPENSYLVPGHGQNLTTELIDQLRSYGLGKIHLVVLSACETAVGDRASDGMEIPGISYFFLKNEVKAVMASLWNVNDASTALIMQQFYTHIAAGMTKAQALQTVQQDLINGKFTAKDAPKRSGEADIRVTVAPGTSASRPSNFAHPYYWAPFILIGNSL